MSTTGPTLEIAAPKKALPTCTPYLMPFHIAYSGPAPLSTYFRVKPAPASLHTQDTNTNANAKERNNNTSTPAETDIPSSSSSQSTLVAISSTTPLDPESQDTEMADANIAERSQATAADTKRLVAAFRGRTVQGLQVDLPEGYSGLVLCIPDGSKNGVREDERGARNTRGKGRDAMKRTTRRSTAVDVDAEERGSRCERVASTDGQDVPARVLQPTSTFSSFVLWNQDISVDEGKDEYLRSLMEWTKLAAEIHHFEDDED